MTSPGYPLTYLLESPIFPRYLGRLCVYLQLVARIIVYRPLFGCRITERDYSRPVFSEPDLKFSLHPARATTTLSGVS